MRLLEDKESLRVGGVGSKGAHTPLRDDDNERERGGVAPSGCG